MIIIISEMIQWYQISNNEFLYIYYKKINKQELV